jgi:predicted RNA-binding protein with PUA-like domain
MQHWLMKTEPSTYSIDDLQKQGKTHWEGVRNYQARNFMRDTMCIGDKVLFYHSNAKPPGIVGLAEVVSNSYPDFFSWDPSSHYFDPKSSPNSPVWYMVDVQFKKKFSSIISLDTLKSHPKLTDLLVTKKGSRLSIQPVSKVHYDIILEIDSNQ